MNKEKRGRIKEVNTKISMVMDLLQQCKSEIESVQMDEEFDFDNLPEGFQEGIRGSSMQDAIDEMEDGVGKIEDIMSDLETIKTNLAIL